MRSFIFSLILIVIIASVTIVTAVSNDAYTDRLLALVDEAFDAPADSRAYAIEQIKSVWEDAKRTVCISVHRKESTLTDTLIDTLDELCERDHSDVDFYGTCRLLEGEMRHIRELSRPSWRSVM